MYISLECCTWLSEHWRVEFHLPFHRSAPDHCGRALASRLLKEKEKREREERIGNIIWAQHMHYVSCLLWVAYFIQS